MEEEREVTALDALLGNGMVDDQPTVDGGAEAATGEGQAEEAHPSHGNVLNVDTMDREYWDELSPRNRFIDDLKAGHIQTNVKYVEGVKVETKSEDQAFNDLLTDGFGAFYKWAPRVLDKVNPAREVNKQVIEQMMNLPEYQQMRNFTRGDEVTSVAALEVVKRVFDAVPEKVKKAQRDVEEAQKKVDDLIDKAEHEGPEGFPGYEKVIKKAVAERDQAAEKLDQQIEAAGDQIRQEARKALQQGAQDAEDAEEVGKAIGWGNQFGDISDVPAAERVKLAQKMQALKDIRKLAELVGRMVRIAERKQAEKVEYERQVIEGITEGDEIPDVVPEEFAKLMNEATRILFYKGFAEQSLQQYHLTAKEEVGRGPMYVGIDCSGSMGINNGEPIRWALAFALTMFWIARKQHRTFGMCLFNTQIVRRAMWHKGEVPNVDQVVKVFGAGTGGGTAYEPPLLSYLDALDKNKAAGKDIAKADFVFITDGICSLRPDVLDTFNRARKDVGFSVYSVLVGNSGKTNTSVLQPFSDKVFCLYGDPSGNEAPVFDATFTI